MILSFETSTPKGSAQVAIVMGLCNGARTLPEQLESFTTQTYRNWSLIVSDDGSVDHGPDLVAEFARRCKNHDVRLIEGPRRGFAQNYLHLLRQVPTNCRYAALSDQDDIWLPEKLSRALDVLWQTPKDIPALYGSRSWIWTPRKGAVRKSPDFKRAPSFKNALVQNISGGNTMVLNRAALDLVQAASCQVGKVVSHDWWLYQIISGAGGVVIHDPRPGLLYRQHATNLVGENRSMRARLCRLKSILSGRYRHWMDDNIAALIASEDWLIPENRALLRRFASLRSQSTGHHIRDFAALGLHRQSRVETTIMWGAWRIGLV